MSASHPPIVERIETAIRDTTAERSPKRYDALMRDALVALTEAQQREERLKADKDLIEAEWGVMARAVGNYRSFTDADPNRQFTEWEIKEFDAASRAILKVATLEAEVARLAAENAALKKEVQEAGEALRLLGVRLYNGAITPDDLAAMLKEGR